jgi:hypothetical protein
MAGDVLGDRLVDPRDAAGEARELGADVARDPGVAGVAEAVLFLRRHALQPVAAMAERAQLLADRIAAGVRGGLALGAEAGEHRRVDPVGLREVERAGEVPGVQRVQPDEVAAGRLEAGAQVAVAAARRLEHDEVLRAEAGDGAAGAAARARRAHRGADADRRPSGGD